MAGQDRQAAVGMHGSPSAVYTEQMARVRASCASDAVDSSASRAGRRCHAMAFLPAIRTTHVSSLRGLRSDSREHARRLRTLRWDDVSCMLMAWPLTWISIPKRAIGGV